MLVVSHEEQETRIILKLKVEALIDLNKHHFPCLSIPFLPFAFRLGDKDKKNKRNEPGHGERLEGIDLAFLVSPDNFALPAPVQKSRLP